MKTRKLRKPLRRLSIQCSRGCHPKTYYAVDLFREMDAARENGRIPSEMVPKCPVCDADMAKSITDIAQRV